MKNRSLLLLLLLWSGVSFAQKPFDLQTGDLLFQVSGSNDYTSAIKEVTSGIRGLEFTHVGVAYVEADSVFVLEAIPYGVMKTPLDRFFRHSQLRDGNPSVVVGRLKPRFQPAIPLAIEKIKTLLGKRYDYLFTPNDEVYYCSELIYVSYLKSNGKPIFKMHPMTFRDQKTKQTTALWKAHFERHKAPVPEGVPGTNPGDMSRSEALRIVHSYF